MIAAIGAFDGFHKGHQALLRAAARHAGSKGAGWGAVTFERHPDALLVSPKFKSLFTMRERAILEKFFSIPASIKLEFSKELAMMTPVGFLEYISGSFGVDGVVVGEGFRFGRGRAGTTRLLEAECRRRGWFYEAVPLICGADGVISSTSIRDAVTRGDMAAAWETLGYPFFCAGRVVHGNERGRLLGFPTANLEIASEKVSMRYGVYAAIAEVCGKFYTGAANVGRNPTFSDVQDVRFEVNLLDFSGDLYGRDITVFMLEYLRGEIRFDGAESLIERMTEDAALVRAIGERAAERHAALWNSLGCAVCQAELRE